MPAERYAAVRMSYTEGRVSDIIQCAAGAGAPAVFYRKTRDRRIMINEYNLTVRW